MFTIYNLRVSGSSDILKVFNGRSVFCCGASFSVIGDAEDIRGMLKSDSVLLWAIFWYAWYVVS